MNDPADLIIGHYERHAVAWDADRREAAWNDKRWIDRFVGLLPATGSVLDLGCGGGKPVASKMVADGLQVTEVDSSAILISLCQTRMPHRQWVHADMRSVSLGKRFDGVLAWDSFFHLKHDDQRAMFSVFAAHAVRGGILMFNAGLAHGNLQADVLADETLDIADDSEKDVTVRDGKTVMDFEHIQRSRLRVETRKWMTAKLAPKKYGDRVTTEHVDPDGKTIDPFARILAEIDGLSRGPSGIQEQQTGNGTTTTH